MPTSTGQRKIAVKQVICTHCERACQVARRAMSVFCPHCKKRLILEDFRINSYYGVRDFSTCGDILVERGGYVAAPIKVGNLTVKGKVEGRVSARGKVTIHKTGWLRGDVEAPSLLVETGAVLEGFVRIAPGPGGNV